MTCQVFHMFLKLCLADGVHFLQTRSFCPCLCLINLSYCLSHQSHQRALVEVLQMVHERAVLAYAL